MTLEGLGMYTIAALAVSGSVVVAIDGGVDRHVVGATHPWVALQRNGNQSEGLAR